MSWIIRFIGFTTRKIIVTVPENCTGSQLFQALAKHPRAPKGNTIILKTPDGEEIENTSSMHLRDYGVENGCSIQLTMQLNGGVWPTVEELEATPRQLRATQQIQTTTSSNQPDVFCLDDDSTRAIMSCGHAVAPLSLAQHCLFELEKGKDEIICPVVFCKTVWKLREVRVAACLSNVEMLAFETRIIENRIKKNPKKIKQCPGCHVYCTRLDEANNRVICQSCSAKNRQRNYEFCWICLRKWKLGGTKKCGNAKCSFLDPETVRLLKTCEEKDLDDHMCPKVRACPECYTVIEHVDKCKHMKCPACQHDFCFVCLKKYESVGHLSVICRTAPRQID